MPKRDPDDLVADHSLRTLSITIGALLLAVTVVLMVNAVQRDREIERALHPTSTAPRPRPVRRARARKRRPRHPPIRR